MNWNKNGILLFIGSDKTVVINDNVGRNQLLQIYIMHVSKKMWNDISVYKKIYSTSNLGIGKVSEEIQFSDWDTKISLYVTNL